MHSPERRKRVYRVFQGCKPPRSSAPAHSIPPALILRGCNTCGSAGSQLGTRRIQRRSSTRCPGCTRRVRRDSAVAESRRSSLRGTKRYRRQRQYVVGRVTLRFFAHCAFSLRSRGEFRICGGNAIGRLRVHHCLDINRHIDTLCSPPRRRIDINCRY